MTPYQKAREWSDLYLPAMNEMASQMLQENNLVVPSFQPATQWQDQREGIDMIVNFDRIKLAYRVRKFNALPYVLNGFTIRRTGQVSELQKIQAGDYQADYLLYGVANPDDDGALAAGILIDMKLVATQINDYPSILNNAAWQSNFVDVRYNDFIDFPCVAYFGMEKQGDTFKGEIH